MSQEITASDIYVLIFHFFKQKNRNKNLLRFFGIFR